MHLLQVKLLDKKQQKTFDFLKEKKNLGQDIHFLK